MRSNDRVPHPAWIIQEWLEANRKSQVWLAEQIGYSPKHLNQILRGHVMWSAEGAVRLEQATGIPATRLMELKVAYELAQARHGASR